ncbi:MAG TPA: matrixin family metalloprotease [Pseudomonadales bacterium]
MPKRPVVALLLCALTGSGALAFTLGGSRWFAPTTTFYIGMTGSSPSGVAWSTALRQSLAQWSDATSFDFVANESYLDPCAGFRRNDNDAAGFPMGSGDRRNGIDFRSTVCGNNFGAGVLAITLSLSIGGPLGFPVFDQTDIIFNSNYQWDVYTGNPQQRIDFRRVALHELGHAIGLDHSSATASIMAPNYGQVHTLQADDISGVNAIYGASACQVRDVATNAAVAERLAAGDCRVRDLFGGSTDTSFVDVYRLTLARETELDIALESSELDPVLILTDAKLGGIEIHDDTDGTCNARIRKRLPAGEYRVLVNTFVEPQKCAGNEGAYNLTLSDSGMPLLGNIGNAGGGASLANAVITGGATSTAGASFTTSFGASQPFDVLGRIVVDPAHVGRSGRLFVLAVLGDGRRFAQNSSGAFVPFTGDIGSFPVRRSTVLHSTEQMSVVSGLRGDTSGLAGQTVTVYLGYALDSSPTDIWYGKQPIRFTIAPQ